MIKQSVATRLSKSESKRCPERKISKGCPERCHPNPLQYPPEIFQEVKMAKERLSKRKIKEVLAPL